jgi:hypothetical protein
MTIKCGLTTWNVSVAGVGLVWRWNMRLPEALCTCSLHRFGRRGFAAVGPLIVEW